MSFTKMQGQTKTSYFPALTGFRAIAALFVFLFHYSGFWKTSPAWGITNEMYTGVGMFFVLSGFLITHTYFDSISTGKFSAYWLKRFGRIFPLFLILTTLSMAYKQWRQPDADFLLTYFLNVTLLKGFSAHYMFTGLTQAWSLTVEECFYLSAPVIFFLVRKWRMLWLQPPFLILIGWLAYQLAQLSLRPIFFESAHFVFFTTFFGRCIEFYAGIQLALWYRRNPGFRSKGFYTAAGLVTIVACLFLMNEIRITNNTPHAAESVAGIIVNNLVFPFAVFLFLRGLLTERTIISGFLGSRPLELLGRASFAFYLIHAGLFADLIGRFTGESVILKFVLLEGLAIILYALIERPLNRFVRKLGGINN